MNYGEVLVEKNDIVFTEKKLKDEKKSDLEYELLTLAKPKKNSKAFGVFRTSLWAYYKTDEPQDTSSFDRFLRRKVAQKPALYSDSIANASAISMTNYLNKKGYFEAEVRPEEQIYKKRKIAKVEYYVTLGERYYVDSLQYISLDSSLVGITRDLEKTSLFQKGEPVSQNLYNAEVNRITDTLRNNGYAFFYDSYIQNLEADSTGSDRQLDLDLKISAPSNAPSHTVYRIGEIQVFPNYNIYTVGNKSRDTIINNIKITIPQEENFSINPQVLINQIYLKSGQIFRQYDYDKTNELLSRLGLFRFIDLKLIKDETDEDKLNVKIYLTRSKRLALGMETELNNSFRSTLTTNRILALGGGLNFNFQNKNTFGGGELLNIVLEGGVEVNIGDRQPNRSPLNSLDLLARAELYYPKFIDYLGYWKLLNKIKIGKNKSLVTNNFYKDLREKARSKVSVSYTYQDFFDFYTFNTFGFSLGYNLKRKANENISFTQTGIDFFKSEIRDSFQVIVDQNTFLERSLGDDQLFTGFIVRDLNYAWASNLTKRNGSWKFRLGAEVSGLEVLGLNAIINQLDEPFSIGGISFAHYGRADFDIRYQRNFVDNSSLAFRLYSGAAVPISRLTSAVPYVKQYFIGGPNSVRAWLIRELGPGSFQEFPAVEPPLFQDTPQPPFYQAADFKLEFNAEYRFDLIPYFLMEGALFVDGGNIWTFREDPERIGSKLTQNFINDIALGGGFGIRFDFSYFIIRLDMGYKLRSPYEVNGSKWLFSTYRNRSLGDFFTTRADLVNYNLAIGYPF